MLSHAQTSNSLLINDVHVLLIPQTQTRVRVRVRVRVCVCDRVIISNS